MGFAGAVTTWGTSMYAHMEFFEEACWQFYAMLGLTASRLCNGEVHLAAVQQNISYQKELYPGDAIMVRTGVIEMREKVLRFRHELLDTERGAICATCDFTVVCLEPKARKSQPFPAEVGQRATELAWASLKS